MVLVVSLTIVLRHLICRVCLIPIGRICCRQWCQLAQRWMAGGLIRRLGKTSPYAVSAAVAAAVVAAAVASCLRHV